jgi:ferrochelatase
MTKLAVVLFNLGGPDRPQAIRPFLFNLFRDKAIMGLPYGLRQTLAWLIAWQRAKVARGIYEQMGGRSPLLPQTRDQANRLQTLLGGQTDQVRVFIAMRYWHPLTAETAAEIRQWKADRIVLLPLYPQYSSTTTGSSLRAWEAGARDAGLAVPTRIIRSYPTAPGMIAAQSDLLGQTLAQRDPAAGSPRLLFSAHGLPQRIVDRGDPYPTEVGMTVTAIMASLGRPDLDGQLCYQSRVGPLEWIGPSLDSEIRRAGKEGKPVVVLPVSFVSEHAETLVELDRDYARLALQVGVPDYRRVPALGVHPYFLWALVGLIREIAHD